MAHKKAAGSTRQQGNRQGKHRGVKRFAGEYVIPGTILVQQVGTVIKPGENVGIGRDFTIFAKAEGTVQFKNLEKNKKIISVVASKA